MALDPVEIIVARAGVADHLPADHVAVAAIQRIGKKSFLHVLNDEHEEGFAVDPFEFCLSILDACEKFILLLVGQIRKTLALIFRLAVSIERGERFAIRRRRVLPGLWALLLCARQEGWLGVMTV